MNNVTGILDRIRQGEPQAAAQLLPLVYEELRRLAGQKLAKEQPGQTLQPTALVHEAYLRLVGGGAEQQWDNRGHFFAAAAEAMRRILVDGARHRQRLKRRGVRHDIELDAIAGALAVPQLDLLALDEALTQLAAEDSRKAELVKLRYFAGLSLEEAADALGIARATAARHWAYARAWLFDRLGSGDSTLT